MEVDFAARLEFKDEEAEFYFRLIADIVKMLDFDSLHRPIAQLWSEAYAVLQAIVDLGLLVAILRVYFEVLKDSTHFEKIHY